VNPWLQHKTAGLPRWAWIALFSGAVMVGIYFRTRAEEEEYGPEEEPIEEPLEGLSEYEGTEQAGGLAAAGLVGPAAAQITPVESPVIPEGFVDVFQSQSETLGSAIGALSEREPGERVETIREVEPIGEGSPQGLPAVTGGGAPKKKPHHKPPKKPKQKKPPRPKQQKPKQHKPRKRQRKGKAAVGHGHRAR
jgi:hypothetical protein